MTQVPVEILDHWTTQRPQRTNFVPPRVVETVSLGVGVSSLSAVNGFSGSLSYKNFAGISQPITIQNAPFSPTISTAGVTLVMEGINYPQVSIPNVAMPIPRFHHYIKPPAVCGVIRTTDGLDLLPLLGWTNQYHIEIDSAEVDDAPQWMALVRSEDTAGRRVPALNLLFGKVDDRLSGGRFDEVDALLKSLDVEGLSENIIVGILSITRRASDRLQFRKEFFEKAWKVVESRGRNVERLLNGLR